MSIIRSFHVPLFFFLSGIVISKAPTPAKWLGKVRRFLLPMLIVGGINAVIIGRIQDFFLNGGHNGYWYLLVLTIFYTALLPFQLTNIPRGWKTFIADCVMALGIIAVFFLIIRYADNLTANIINSWACFSYWPFFIIGVISRKYGIIDMITGKKWLTVILITAYIVIMAASFSNIDHLPLLLDFTIALIAIAALTTLFFHFSEKNTFLDRQMLLIGNNTLYIYILHYFFIRFIDLSVLRHASAITEYAIIFPLTIAIVYGSIGIKHVWDKMKAYSSSSDCSLTK
jgi:fucose 4-O-acetylase-like acetyltransferase